MGEHTIKFPENVYIRGKLWAVFVVAGLRDAEDDPVLGICKYNRRTIEIEADQTDDSKLEVFFHEIAHAYAFLTPIPGLADGYHEAICDHFASYLVDFLGTNDTGWMR